MTGQITCKSHKKSSKCQNFLEVWHLVIFRADQSKKPPCVIKCECCEQLILFTEDNLQTQGRDEFIMKSAASICLDRFPRFPRASGLGGTPTSCSVSDYSTGEYQHYLGTPTSVWHTLQCCSHFLGGWLPTAIRGEGRVICVKDKDKCKDEDKDKDKDKARFQPPKTGVSKSRGSNGPGSCHSHHLCAKMS